MNLIAYFFSSIQKMGLQHGRIQQIRYLWFNKYHAMHVRLTFYAHNDWIFLSGLMHNDCLRETPDVIEALKRLPTKLLDERNYRQYRALHLSGCHRILPKEQWTKCEEDVRYLEPYLEEVQREREEREEWEKNN